MKDGHFETQLFEEMKIHHVNSIPALLKKVKQPELPIICIGELDYIARFYSGNYTVTEHADGTVAIDGSEYLTALYNAEATADKTHCRVDYADSTTEYDCVIESFAGIVSLVSCGESVMMWPTAFLRKED